MVKETEFHKKVAAEKAHLQKEEDNKRFLHDRTIGGTDVPRPSPEFIEKCVGSMKSETQIQKEAEERAAKQVRQEQAEQERRREVDESLRRHNERVAQQQAEKERNAEMFRQAAARNEGRKL